MAEFCSGFTITNTGTTNTTIEYRVCGNEPERCKVELILKPNDCYYINTNKIEFFGNNIEITNLSNVNQQYFFSGICNNGNFWIAGKFGITPFTVGNTYCFSSSDCFEQNQVSKCFTLIDIGGDYGFTYNSWVSCPTYSGIDPAACISSCCNPPPTTTTTTTQPTPKLFDYVNECEPITIFPLGVECYVVNPSTPNGTDGSASLLITGGTPPYSITWDNLNIGPSIFNLGPGSYGATVTDFYGDFTASTICVLTGKTISPTPTPTPSPTPPPPPPPVLCMRRSNSRIEQEQVEFVDSGTNYDGRPSWTNIAGDRKIVWSSSTNYWVVSASTTPYPVIYNSDTSYPPAIGGWNMLNPQAGSSVQFTQGVCIPPVILLNKLTITLTPPPPFSIFVSKNDTICGCDGNISIIPNGGTPPYQYSIDSGITFRSFPIFTNLCYGLYVVNAIDDAGQEYTTTINLPSPSEPIAYNITTQTTNSIVSSGSFTKTIRYETTINVTPPLPDGVTIIFSLNHINSSQSSPTITSSTVNTNSQLVIDGVIVGTTSVFSGDSTQLSTIDGCQLETIYTTSNFETWENITYTNQTDLTLTTITEINKNINDNCYIGSSTEEYQIYNASLNGCYCCNLIVS